jgi:hypothetical protein
MYGPSTERLSMHKERAVPYTECFIPLSSRPKRKRYGKAVLTVGISLLSRLGPGCLQAPHYFYNVAYWQAMTIYPYLSMGQTFGFPWMSGKEKTPP